MGTALYGEKGVQRVRWVEEKLYALLEGKLGTLIGGLRQRLTKKQNQLTPTQKKTVEKAITYFDNHRHMMRYDIYLEKGYPIATGVIEGACRHLVKDRMERSGRQWTLAGAQAMLHLRALRQSSYWDEFQQRQPSSKLTLHC